MRSFSNKYDDDRKLFVGCASIDGLGDHYVSLDSEDGLFTLSIHEAADMALFILNEIARVKGMNPSYSSGSGLVFTTDSGLRVYGPVSYDPTVFIRSTDGGDELVGEVEMEDTVELALRLLNSVANLPAGDEL